VALCIGDAGWIKVNVTQFIQVRLLLTYPRWRHCARQPTCRSSDVAPVDWNWAISTVTWLGNVKVFHLPGDQHCLSWLNCQSILAYNLGSGRLPSSYDVLYVGKASFQWVDKACIDRRIIHRLIFSALHLQADNNRQHWTISRNIFRL